MKEMNKEDLQTLKELYKIGARPRISDDLSDEITQLVHGFTENSDETIIVEIAPEDITIEITWLCPVCEEQNDTPEKYSLDHVYTNACWHCDLEVQIVVEG